MTFLRRMMKFRKISTGGVVSNLSITSASGILSYATTGFAGNTGITYKTDGTGPVTNDTGGDNVPWYTPTTAGIGNSYWVKFQLFATAGLNSPWDTAAAISNNTIYSLNTDRVIRWSVGAGGVTKTASVNVLIYSDSGGTNLVGSGVIEAFASSA